MERWRCFVAVPLPKALRSKLSEVVRRWREEPNGPDLRWTGAAGWHLTLAFLGWVDAEMVAGLLERLADPAARASRADVGGGGVGAFPSPRRARVVWYDVADDHGQAAALAEGVRRSLSPMVPSVDDGSPFRPHVTLARARAERGADLRVWLPGRAVPSGVIPLERVILYRSHLGRGPARYEPLGSVAVGTGERAVSDVEAEASVHG